jgi:hypothetical protein
MWLFSIRGSHRLIALICEKLDTTWKLLSMDLESHSAQEHPRTLELEQSSFPISSPSLNEETFCGVYLSAIDFAKLPLIYPVLHGHNMR